MIEAQVACLKRDMDEDFCLAQPDKQRWGVMGEPRRGRETAIYFLFDTDGLDGQKMVWGRYIIVTSEQTFSLRDTANSSTTETTIKCKWLKPQWNVHV